MIQQGLEPTPSVTAALTAPVEPLEQDALAPVEELNQAGSITNHPVVVPVPPIFGLHGLNNHRQRSMSAALDPGGEKV